MQEIVTIPRSLVHWVTVQAVLSSNLYVGRVVYLVDNLNFEGILDSPISLLSFHQHSSPSYPPLFYYGSFNFFLSYIITY